MHIFHVVTISCLIACSVVFVVPISWQNAPCLSVSLNKPIDSIKGFMWPRSPITRQLDYLADVDCNGMINIELPGRRKLNIESKGTSLCQKDGKLVHVILTYQREPVPLQQALESSASLAKYLGIEKQKEMRERILVWKDKKTKSEKLSAHSIVGYHTGAFIEIDRIVSLELIETGWTIKLTISYYDDWNSLRSVDAEAWDRLNSIGKKDPR